MKIDTIVIGDRFRKDMGDIASLAESMKRHGLLHPVVVKSDGTLIAGHRRIEAARLLGWADIPVTSIDMDDLLCAERDENTERKDFTPTEAVAIGRVLEERHRELVAYQRHELKVRAGKIAHGSTLSEKQAAMRPVGETRNAVAEAVGFSATNYYLAKSVIAAAESDPQKFGDLPEIMDRTGNVSGTHQEMKRRKGANGKNGKPARHPALRKMHYPKPNREVERAIPALDGICEVLEAIEPAQLIESQRRGWSQSLSKIASRLNKVARRINGQV